MWAARTAVIWAWNAVLPPLWAGQATGVAPGDGLGPGVGPALGEADAAAVDGDGRAAVAAGVTATVVRAVLLVGVTGAGEQAATARTATPQNRRIRAFKGAQSDRDPATCR